MNSFQASRIDLLILCTAPHIGGMQRMVCGVARQFTGQGAAVRTVFPAGPGQSALLEWCQEQGVSAEVWPELLDAAEPHSLEAVANLRRRVASTRPRVVNLHYGDNTISLKDVVAVRMGGAKRIMLTVHHPTPWTETTRRKRLLTRLGGLLSDGVIVPSLATRDVMLGAGVPRRLVHTVPCGLPEPTMRPTRAAARSRLSISEDSFVVSSLARLVPSKGIGDLIDAASELRSTENFLLLIAGDGPERSDLEARARSALAERARFLGNVADTADLFAASDVFALPSYLEGFGLVYVEAAQHGVPSVGTRVGAVPEVIVDGQTGLLVPPRDAHALASALARLQADPSLRSRLGAQARDRARTEFAEERMATGYAQAFAGRSGLEATLRWP